MAYLYNMKQTAISSILAMTCPRCRKGNMFPTGSFSFREPFTMHDHCPHCQQDLAPEPGFYYGAMFLSYILTGWFCLAFVAIVHWILGLSLISSFALLILVTGVLFVWFFRISRSIWIHINVKYASQD